MNFYVHVCGVAVEFVNDFVAWLFILCVTWNSCLHVFACAGCDFSTVVSVVLNQEQELKAVCLCLI